MRLATTHDSKRTHATQRDAARRLLGKLAEHLKPQSLSTKVEKSMFSSLVKDLSDNHSGVRAKSGTKHGENGDVPQRLKNR